MAGVVCCEAIRGVFRALGRRKTSPPGIDDSGVVVVSVVKCQRITSEGTITVPAVVPNCSTRWKKCGWILCEAASELADGRFMIHRALPKHTNSVAWAAAVTELTMVRMRRRCRR